MKLFSVPLLLMALILTVISHPLPAATPAKPIGPANNAPAVNSPEDAAKAAVAPKVDPNTVPGLRVLISQGAKIIPLGRLHGLDGWVAYQDKSVEMVYTTPDGDGLVVGMLYGPAGENETTKQLAELDRSNNPDLLALRKAAEGQVATAQNQLNNNAPAAAAPVQASVAAPAMNDAVPPAGSPGDRLMADAEHLPALSFGAADLPVLYVVADPRCPYCKALWQNLATNILPQGKVQVHLIPVGIIGPDSAPIATQILSSKDPIATWGRFVAGNGSTDMLNAATPSGAAALQSNHDFIHKWKITGVPFSFYRNSAGKVMVISGEGIDNVVADMTGGK